MKDFRTVVDSLIGIGLAALLLFWALDARGETKGGPPETAWFCVIAGVIPGEGSGAQIVSMRLKQADCLTDLKNISAIMRDKPEKEVMAWGATCVKVNLQHDKT